MLSKFYQMPAAVLSTWYFLQLFYDQLSHSLIVKQ